MTSDPTPLVTVKNLCCQPQERTCEICCLCARTNLVTCSKSFIINCIDLWSNYPKYVDNPKLPANATSSFRPFRHCFWWSQLLENTNCSPGWYECTQHHRQSETVTTNLLSVTQICKTRVDSYRKKLTQLTFRVCTEIVGLADGYSRNKMLMPTPISIPISTPTAKQMINVANAGIKSFLLDFHIGLTTSYSIMKITAQIMTAASEALGM